MTASKVGYLALLIRIPRERHPKSVAKNCNLAYGCKLSQVNPPAESKLNHGGVDSKINDNSALYREQNATTAMVTDQGTFVQRDVTSNDPYVDSALDNNAHLDVRDYFSKPMPVWTGTFSTQGPDAIIYSADLFTLFNSQDIWYQKVKGYLNFRGTVRLRLVANPTPFQAGLLRLSYFPCENVLNKEAVAHTSFRVPMSQIPGVFLPLTKNEATLCVPYVAPTHYIELSNTNRYSWGKVYISVFQSLRTGTGPTSVNLTLWMSVDDAEVSGQILPQGEDVLPTPFKAKAPNSAPQSSEKRHPIVIDPDNFTLKDYVRVNKCMHKKVVAAFKYEGQVKALKDYTDEDWAFISKKLSKFQIETQSESPVPGRVETPPSNAPVNYHFDIHDPVHLFYDDANNDRDEQFATDFRNLTDSLDGVLFYVRRLMDSNDRHCYTVVIPLTDYDLHNLHIVVSRNDLQFKIVSDDGEQGLFRPDIQTQMEEGEAHSLHGKSVVKKEDNPKRRLVKPKRGTNPTEKESNGGQGPVSKMMSVGINVASSLSEVPALQPLMGPLAWAMNAVRGAAIAVGWSKPVIERSYLRVARGTNWYSVNANTDDNSQPMSLMVDNKLICVDDAADMGRDEMSINYIKTVNSYLQDIQWNTQAVGSQLYALNIAPILFRFPVSDSNGNAVSIATPLAYLADMFEYYRGSIELKFKFIKTGFHTGALAFTYVPGVAPANISLNDTAYPFRVIFDIQTGDEISFTLPYMNPRDYLRYTESMGRFFVHIVNPLINPATVASTIDLAVFIKGGNDLEFQFPTTPSYAPIIPQGVDVVPEEEVIDTVMGASSLTVDTRFSELTMGEHIMSLLQVIKAFWVVTGNSNSTFSGSVFVKTHRFYAYTSTVSGSSSTPTVNPPVVGADVISNVASLFAFYRGAMRYRISDPITSGTNGLNRMTLLSYKQNLGAASSDIGPLSGDNAAALNGQAPNYRSRAGRVYVTDQSVGNLAAQVPYYNGVRMSPMSMSKVVGANQIVNNDIGQPHHALGFSTNAPNGQNFMRSVGDDFQFLFFVGVPTQYLADTSAPQS